MFVKSTTKGAGALNVLILLTIVFVAAIAALSVVKIKRDPKNADGYRNTLGFKK